MVIEVERMVAVLEARIDKYEKNLAKAGKVTDTTFNSITKAGDVMEAKLGRLGPAAARGFDVLANSTANAAHQQANLRAQLADVGQSLALGMSPLQVALQQGPQLLSIYGPGGLGGALKETAVSLAGLVLRFAPLLAVIAAGYGAYKLLASYGVEARNAIDDATKALAAQAAPVSSLKGMISDLSDAQKAYKDAIGNTAGQQVAASNTIIAATKAEFDSKKQLFELELKRQQASLLVQQAAVATLGNDLRSRISQQVFTRDDSVRQGTSDPRIGDFTINADRLEGLQKTIDAINADPAIDQIKQLKAELTLNEIAAAKMKEALDKAWSGAPIEIDKATTATKSSTAATKEATDAWAGLRQVSDQVAAAQQASAAKIAERIAFEKDLVNGALSDMRSALEDGKLTWEDLGNVAVNALNRAGDRAPSSCLNDLFNGATQ